MKALIVVDVQKDFCPGGSLATAGGDAIIPTINELMQKFEIVVASKDWHPGETVHFEKWPVHCVRGTDGARFHEQLDASKIDEVVLKGTGNTDDGYSAFEATNIDLEAWLKKQQVNEVVVCGIASEYCVQATALDARKAGFKTSVVSNAISAVEAKAGDTERAIENLKSNDIQLIRSDQV